MSEFERKIIEFAVKAIKEARKYGVIGIETSYGCLDIQVRSKADLTKIFGHYDLRHVEYGVGMDGELIEDNCAQVKTPGGVRWFACLDMDDLTVEEAKELQRQAELMRANK